MLATKSVSSKALIAHLVTKGNDGDRVAMREWNMAGCSHGKSPDRLWWDCTEKYNVPQSELDATAPHDLDEADANGASKLVYWHDAQTGMRYDHIVVKVERTDRHSTSYWGWQIQCRDEVKAWEALAKTPDADLLCPVLKYFKPKSDHPGLKKSRSRMMVISQKAVFIGSLEECLQEAQTRNTVNRKYSAEGKAERRERIIDLCNRMGWRDVLHHGANCGVIYDYHNNCYKAVIVDYAL